MTIGYVASQLIRPFSYLRVKHAAKSIYDWVIPALLTALTLVYFIFTGLHGVVSTNDGLIVELVSFVSNLPGFYIAALAAVATFNRADMDVRLPEPTPEIETLIRGQDQIIKLTRRRYLCLLFAFLTGESIFLVIFTKLAFLIEIDMSGSFYLMCWAGVAMFFLFFWQLITATLYGLFYMGDKMHEPKI